MLVALVGALLAAIFAVFIGSFFMSGPLGAIIAVIAWGAMMAVFSIYIWQPVLKGRVENAARVLSDTGDHA